MLSSSFGNLENIFKELMFGIISVFEYIKVNNSFLQNVEIIIYEEGKEGKYL